MFVMQLVEYGDTEGLPERLLSNEFLTELFSPREIEEITSKTAAVAQDVMDIPELLLKSDWDMPDFTVSSKLLVQHAQDWCLEKSFNTLFYVFISEQCC